MQLIKYVVVIVQIVINNMEKKLNRDGEIASLARVAKADLIEKVTSEQNPILPAGRIL